MRMDTSGRLLIGHNTYDADNAGVFANGASGKLFCTVRWRCSFKLTQTII